MIDMEREEMAVLARARRALSPTMSDQQRVGLALKVALAAGHTPMVASRLLTNFLVAAVAVGSGYWIGHRAGMREAQTDLAVVVRRAPIDAPVNPSSVPQSTRRAMLPPAVAALLAPWLSPPSGPAPSPRHPHPARNLAAAAPGATLSPAESLNEELRVLRAVERALRDRHPGLALALLRELDRTIPEGKLMEERAATSAIARCSSGDVPLDVDLGEEFADHFPDSVYSGRVEQSCR